MVLQKNTINYGATKYNPEFTSKFYKSNTNTMTFTYSGIVDFLNRSFFITHFLQLNSLILKGNKLCK